MIKFAIPIAPNGDVGGGFGKAHMMAVGTIVNGEISDWQEHEVDWDRLHDEGPHGTHHARIIRFMQDNEVTHVLGSHMGEPMQNTFAKLGLPVTLDLSGNARAAVIAVLSSLE